MIVETVMIKSLKLILRASIVVGIRVENIEMMMIEVIMRIKLVVRIMYVICVIDLVILLFIARMLNVTLVVKRVTLLDTAL